jgi:hypothetical protein
MHRLLIPILACLFLSTPVLLRAQVAHEIQYLPFDAKKVQQTPAGPEMMCGNAGTYTIGQFLGSSNDVGLPTIFLCFGDSLLVQHNGDADLSGDPNPATPAGVAFAFYDCPPTITGPTLQDIGEIPGLGDPCVLSGSGNGLFITQAVADSGAIWFFNSGALQTNFNMGQPLSLFFAPITVDNFAANTYESAQVGFPPGPCVAVNTAAAFEVVYLNEITATGINSNFMNDCIGRFTVRGGYPQYNSSAVYTIDISLASDPSVKAIVQTSATNLFHLSSVSFSVPQSGLYNVVIEDGKSCPATFQIDMNVCNAADNVVLSFPNTIIPPGTQVCVPVTVQNFSIFSASFSIEWDELVLQYDELQNVSPVISTFFGPANLNTLQTSLGLLGVQIFDNITPATITIPNDSVLFEMCFTGIGQLGDCSGLGVTNSPAGVAIEDEMGLNLALSVDTGRICMALLPLALTYEVIDTTCLGQATLTITPTGGALPYEVTVAQQSGPTYSTTNGTILEFNGVYTVQSPVGSTNNTPISYDICVRDSNGFGLVLCTTLVVNIKRIDGQLNFAQQPLCNGDSTGIINAVVLDGGVVVPSPGPNYTYAWAPANLTVQGSQVQNNVPAGLYSVTITNLNTTCSAVASGSLGQPAPLSSQSVMNTPASCSGVCDGSILYEAEGGTPFAGGTYQFSWTYENNNTPQSSGSANPIQLNNACAGEYRISLTDANGCTFIDSNLVLNDLRELSINTNAIVSVACNGQSNGSINVTVAETVPSGNNFTFNWTPSGFMQGGMSPTGSYSGLPAGTYSVIATDNLGCKIADTFLINQPQVLNLDTFALVFPGCAQANSGSICVQALGGNGGLNSYVYTWSNPGATNNNCQSGLPVGTYTVTVTDTRGCQDSLLFVLPTPGEPMYTLNTTQVKCGGDGALSVTATSAVIIVWKDINGVVIDSTATIDNLDGGDYILTLYDATGCFAIDTFTLNGVIPMSFSNVTLEEPTCFGYNDGKIAIGVQDGQPPYVSYQWNQTQSGPVIFGLIAGTYVLTVTDNAGCTLTGSFVLNEPPAIVNSFNIIVGQVTCLGGLCDGAAAPLAAYTNGPGDFNFLWSDGSFDSLRIDLCAGLNIVTITDINNCFLIDSVVITAPPAITGVSTTTDTKCFGDNTGTASISPAGGNGGPYTFLWNNGGATTQTITGLAAGVYTVTLTDNKSCTNSINSILVGQPAPIGLSTTATNPKCFGGETGQTSVDVLGGIPTYTYKWEDANGDNIGSGKMVEMLLAGSYDVTVTDANGCTSVANAVIVDPPPVIGDYEDLAPLSCNGDETTLNIISISGGAGAPYKFSVDFGAVLDPSFPVTLGGGEHFITYIDVQDCAFTETITVAEPSPITVTFDPNIIEVELGATADLEPIITGVAVIGGFTWTNPQALLNPDTLNATAYTFSNLTYTLTVLDSFGCAGVGSVTVTVDPNRNVFIPNVFIPANASGLNDHFNIYTGLGVETVNFMRVYDRWGELLFQREKFSPNVDNLSEGWDGRYNGDFVNPGVYVYLAEVKFLDGRVLLYRGDVTVVR